MERLNSTNTLLVKQKKEWGEILTGFESKNKYEIISPEGQPLFLAAEESSFMARHFLKSIRPYRVHIMSSTGEQVLQIEKMFRFYYHEAHVFDKNNCFIGSIKREFSVFARNFLVFDSAGQEIYRINGPFIHPWTFRILQNEIEAGKISKKWTGLGKEMFTDADNFNINFPPDATVDKKSILLGALFLIDMLYFEQK